VWASYDAAFRRQAANRRSFDWAAIDPMIYNEAFTGRAYSLAATTAWQRCTQPRSASLPHRPATWGPPAAERGRSIELCQLLNRPEGNLCAAPPRGAVARAGAVPI
jgi:hypothetical protein